MIKKLSQDYLYEPTDTIAVTHKQHVINEYNIYLFGEIKSSDQFLNAIEILNVATAEDIVKLNLSSVGGSLHACDTLLFEMQKAQARDVQIHIIGSGLIASAGSLILLNGSSFELSDDAVIMLHCGSLGESGTLAEFRTASRFYTDFMEHIFSKHYQYLLSDDEIAELVAGKDFWFTSHEFATRYEHMQECIANEMDMVEAESE